MDSKLSKDEYGDWQTSYTLALSVCKLLKHLNVNPQVVIEPTCGKGSFVMAALQTFDAIEHVYGIEINPDYLDSLRQALGQGYAGRRPTIHLINDDVFKVDFDAIKHQIAGKNVLVLGNPPWVTNSEQGKTGKDNLPTKSNFKHAKGLDAITGKGNFDIAEYITYMMLELMKGEQATIAMLLKTSVIKNIMYEQHDGEGLTDACQYNIDTEKEFHASAAAALFVAKAGHEATSICNVYDFYSGKYIKTFGWVGNHFVANCDNYEHAKSVDGRSPLTWWSGLKHDCSKVLELSKSGNCYFNKLDERVDIEEGIVYPFLKSSDLKGGQAVTCRKYIILTQHHVSDDTADIKNTFPKAYNYLQSHVSFFENRKSAIYKGKPKFCLFGVGVYTFKNYRIAVSGLYKDPHFTLVSYIGNKQALLDDTTYLLGFDNCEYAKWTLRLLNSPLVLTFLKSVSFEDAKRPVNKDLLMRIDLAKALEVLGKDYIGISSEQFDDYMSHLRPTVQPSLV